MKYKKGDLVILVSKRPGTWNPHGLMDMFLGSIQKLSTDPSPFQHIHFKSPETKFWVFNEKCIQGLAVTLEKLINVD